jgi:hypothetical protein
METRERCAIWRRESGYDRIEAARKSAEEANKEAEEVLVRTMPTTVASLIALLEHFTEDGLPSEIDDWEDTVLPNIAEVVRKFAAAPVVLTGGRA